jgi:hypothetical protein
MLRLIPPMAAAASMAPSVGPPTSFHRPSSESTAAPLQPAPAMRDRDKRRASLLASHGRTNKVSDQAFRAITRTRHRERFPGPPKHASGHYIFGEGAGLIGANDGCAAKHLNRGANYRVPPGHAGPCE